MERSMMHLEELMEQGNSFFKQGKLEQALLYFKKIILLSSEHIESLIAVAEILMNLNRPQEAALYSEHALQIKSDCTLLTLHGKTLYQMGAYEKALQCFERVLLEETSNYIAMGQQALCLTQLNRYEEALTAYQKALTYNHNDPWIQYNYSLCLLAMGNLTEGFALYEYRWACTLRAKSRIWRIPESIQMLRGKSILVSSEQGLGDSILFFRYIPQLVQLGARVFLELQPSIIPLFSSWRNIICFFGSGDELPTTDFHCSMMSLAKLFKTEMHTIPRTIPYVFPDMMMFESCQKKLGYTHRKRIGFSWKGSANNAMNQKRSIKLSDLLTLHQPQFDFICLQKDVNLEEKKVLDQYKIAYHSLELNTLAGTAALITCLDLIITIDTSIAHLAAAMGKEVWILLPLSADWRWFLQREDSPWYPNVRLFRQETLGNWSFPLLHVKNNLGLL